MTNYRQTMADAYGQVKLNEEANDFGLSGTITDTQLANLKKVWATKSKKDITPGIKSMIAKMDVPTQVAVKHAKINVISDLIEATEDHEVSMAIGQLKTISQYASKLQSILQSKGDDYNIEAWVQSKITSAEDYMNSVGHYMENNPDVNEQLEENFSASQIARLKKEYEVMRGKKISIANANKLSQMFKNIPDSGLVDIFKADIPFLSVMAMTKMIQKNIPRPAGVKLRLEEVEILDEATQNEIEITEGKIDGKKFDSLKKGDTMTITYNSTMSGTTVKKFVVKNKTRSAKYNTDKVKLEIEGKPGTSPFYLYKRKNGDVSFAQGDMAATVVAVKEQLAEGRMSDIDQMQKDGKSAAEIAKLMKLDVKTVKSILGEVNEEELHEFKKMTVSFNSHADMSKASTDLAKKGFTITGNQKALKIDGNGADLNKYATDLKNFYGATVRAENYTIDESADEDNYDPITEACWVGWTQKGMKKKGDRMVPNCVKESINEEEDPNKLANELKQKENEIAQLKQKAETDKAKNVQKSTQKMVNPETGEPLLQVGIAYKHLKTKMAKDAAAKDDAEEKEKQNKKELVAKFKDRIRESLNLTESDASDKAKSMGLTYMKFGRYGKDGKVTHKSIGGNLTAVDKNEKPIKEPKSDKPKDEPKKDEPKAEPKPALDTFQAQKDLEDMVTDGIIDVEDDGKGGVNMTKEYEPSQDYEAEQDVKSIKKYLKDKGIDEKDILVDVESEEEYIQINVEVRGKKMDESTSKFTSQQIKMAYGVANDKRYKGGNYSGAVAAIEKIAKGLSLHPDVQNVLKRTNEDVQEMAKDKMKKEDVKEGYKTVGNEKGTEWKVYKNGKLIKTFPTYIQAHDYVKKNESITEMAKDKAYAIGMSTAKKKYNDEPPLDKKTIKKAHEIGDKLSKMKNEDHPAKKMFEQIEGLKNKAEKSGMPYGILKQVYDRGMAAWRGGHRPGTTQQQWAFARVNSFITKSSGTWGGADKDLAAKVKGN